MFLTVQHNMTVPNPSLAGDTLNYFTNGWKDICTILFYFLICIVIHAIILEYVLDVSIELFLSVELLLESMPMKSVERIER